MERLGLISVLQLNVLWTYLLVWLYKVSITNLSLLLAEWRFVCQNARLEHSNVCLMSASAALVALGDYIALHDNWATLLTLKVC